MKKVFIVHGFEGKPNGGWRPWLMRELEKLDIYACALAMPAPESPECHKWVEEIARHIPLQREKICLIGHSLGVPAILNFLQIHPHESKFADIILVSGPSQRHPDPNSNSYKKLGSFFTTPFDYAFLKTCAQNFSVIHGDNDAVVPLAHAQHFAKNLNCALHVVKDGGHLNGASGFYTLPYVVEILRSGSV